MNIKTLVPVVVISLLVGLGFGGYFGRDVGYDAARDEFGALLDIAYPPPPQVLYRLSGEVVRVVGGTIHLNVDDPDDYLPHPDGSPRAQELRLVDVRDATELVVIDYQSPDELGNPTGGALELSAIRAGDQLVVESEENIRDAEKFIATRVEKVIF